MQGEEEKIRMITSVDKEEIQLKMTFLQPPKVKTKVIQVNLNHMINISMINQHKKTGDIVSNRLLQTTVDNKKMKSNILILENQLKKEKNFSRVKNIRIQELEANVVSIGSYSLAFDYLKELIESKNVEIKSLKEKSRIPSHETFIYHEVIKLNQDNDLLEKKKSTLKQQSQSLSNRIDKLAKEKVKAFENMNLQITHLQRELSNLKIKSVSEEIEVFDTENET